MSKLISRACPASNTIADTEKVLLDVIKDRNEEIDRLKVILRMVLSNEQMELQGHDWETCLSPSCELARKALKK